MTIALNFNSVGNLLQSKSTNISYQSTSSNNVYSTPNDALSLGSYPSAPPPQSTVSDDSMMSRFTKWLAKVTFDPIMNLIFSVFRPR